MQKLAFYEVPSKYINSPPIPNKLNFELAKGWVEFILTELRDSKIRSSWRSGFFVDNTLELGDILWNLKLKDETLLLHKKVHKRGKLYAIEEIAGKYELQKILEQRDTLGFEYVFLYFKENEIQKIISITPGETLDIFVAKKIAETTKLSISNIAAKVDFYEYELDQ